ncbi:MAG: aminopeptidase P family protein [bacterium]
MIDYVSKYRKVIAQFAEKNIDALLLSNPSNLRYLSGLLMSDAEFVLTPGQSALFVDSRYLLEAQERELPFPVEVIQFKDKYQTIADWLSSHNLHRIGIESDFVSYHNFFTWQEKISGQLIPCRGMVENARIRKDEAEVQLILQAIDIVAKVIEKIPDLFSNFLQITERDVSLEIEYLMKRGGAERTAFDIIVASGERAAMPHAAPVDRKLRPQEVVLIDLGAAFEGYHSDVTRTFWLGEESKEAKELFHILKSAQQAAIDHVRPGVSARDVDAAARQVIDQAGYGQFFGHGTGHGVGIEVHELPRIAPPSETVLEEGMVFTVEPGIYLPGRLGLRLEDMVLVTPQGCQILSSAIAREMVVVGS